MNIAKIILILLCSTGMLLGQEQSSDKPIDQRVIVGIEQDVLPYFLQGWFASAWLGYQKVRIRCAYAQSNIPAFMRSQGFQKDRVSAFGIGFEFFPQGDFKGWWVGPGLGHWTHELQTETGETHWHESFIFSLGGGYVFNITKWLYVSSWTAAHCRISGNRPIDYGGYTYRPLVVTPEVSIKVGVRFPVAKEKSSFKKKKK